jgi:hypothetical protein
MMRVRLTKEKIAEGVVLGTLRQTGHPPTDRDSQRTDNANPYYEHIRGCWGELGFEEISGLKMNRLLLRSGDKGTDFYVHKLIISVTCRKVSHWDLLIKDKDLVVDSRHIYVHSYWNEPYVCFHGWIFGENVIRNKCKFGPAPSQKIKHNDYFVPPKMSQRLSMEELLNLIKVATSLEVARSLRQPKNHLGSVAQPHGATPP